MALNVKPSANLDSLYVGEDEQYEITCTDILDSDTIKTVSIVYTDSTGTAVTANFAKGDSNAAGVITFGLNAYATGSYTITFDITCNEKLPNNSTERNFKFKLFLTVID